MTDGKPVRFCVTVDGQAPGENHRVGTDAEGNGMVTSYRLYQLVRQRDGVMDHVFTIDFLDPGFRHFPSLSDQGSEWRVTWLRNGIAVTGRSADEFS